VTRQVSGSPFGQRTSWPLTEVTDWEDTRPSIDDDEWLPEHALVAA